MSNSDLFGSGTLAGQRPDQAGSLLELTEGGKRPLTLPDVTLPDGETRTFPRDGDAVTLTCRCAREGFRPIGFGPCQATVQAVKR